MLRELIVKEDPKSPISEIFRTLRTNIQFTFLGYNGTIILNNWKNRHIILFGQILLVFSFLHR